ncbi:SRPBCC family protein [Colwelliaceae bacterium BS250]
MAFDIKAFTKAKLQMECKIHFKDNSAQEVFDIMGNPELITEWYILAESVRMHPATADQEASFNVVFTFFGDVYEEVLYWEPPLRYVYLAQGPNFPIKDYVAEIEVVADENKCGVMTWRLYYQEIEGENFKKIIPTLIPAMNKASMEKLSEFIGGYKVDCIIY